jgi:hypothetical protein
MYELTIWALEGDQKYHIRLDGIIIAGFVFKEDAEMFLLIKNKNQIGIKF